MSFFDFAHKSGYGHNSQVYKVETYVEEVRKPSRVFEYGYPSYPTKIDPAYHHNRPPEMDDLLKKILTEVNGPPVITTLSDSETYGGRQRFPVRVESRNYYTDDPWHSPYPSNRDYGSLYNDPSSIDHGVPKHRYQPPQQDLDYPNNQSSRYSHPEYTQPSKNESYGHQPPKQEPKPGTIRSFGVPRTYWAVSYQSDSPKYGGFRDQGSPKNQWGDSNQSNFRPEVLRDEGDPNKRWGDSPRNSQTAGENGVPKGYRVPIYEYDNSPMKLNNDYAIPNNSSLSKPEMSRGQETLDKKSYVAPVKPYDYAGDYGSPDKQWGGYAKTPTRQDYGVPSKPESLKDHRGPYTQWVGSPVTSQTRQDYGVPSKPESPKDPRGPYTQWGGSPARSQTRQDYGVPSKSESPKDHRGPYTQWGGSPEKPQTRQDYGVPSNKGPYTEWGGSPERSQTQQDNGVPSNRGPYTEWGGSPKKSQARQDYGIPSNKGPYTEWGGSPEKSQTRQDYGVPSNRGPYTESGGSPEKLQTRQDYEVPVKPETPKDNRGPYTEWGGSPKNSHNPRNNGVLNNQQKSSSGPENKFRNSPVNSPKLGGYGDPSDHLWDSPPNPVNIRPPNTRFPSQPKTYDEQGHSPMKQQTPPNYTTPSNHSYEPRPQTPPSMTCKDGVCTLNDRPKVTQNPYDEPKDNYIRNYPKETNTDHVQNNGRPTPYTHENQPKNDQQNPSTNRMNNPNGNNNNTRSTTPLGKATNNNIEEPLGQLNLTGSSPNPTTLTSPGIGLSGLSHSRPRTENPKESAHTTIDSKEAVKRYGGLGSVPSRPYSSGDDQSRAISSIEAVEKYNGAVVPK